MEAPLRQSIAQPQAMQPMEVHDAEPAAPSLASDKQAASAERCMPCGLREYECGACTRVSHHRPEDVDLGCATCPSCDVNLSQLDDVHGPRDDGTDSTKIIPSIQEHEGAHDAQVRNAVQPVDREPTSPMQSSPSPRSSGGISVPFDNGAPHDAHIPAGDVGSPADSAAAFWQAMGSSQRSGLTTPPATHDVDASEACLSPGAVGAMTGGLHAALAGLSMSEDSPV